MKSKGLVNAKVHAVVVHSSYLLYLQAFRPKKKESCVQVSEVKKN